GGPPAVVGFQPCCCQGSGPGLCPRARLYIGGHGGHVRVLCAQRRWARSGFLVTLQVTALAVVGTSGHDVDPFVPTTRSFRGVGGHEIAPRLGDRFGVRQKGEAVALTTPRRGTRIADNRRFHEPLTQRVERIEQPPAPLIAELVTR